MNPLQHWQDPVTAVIGAWRGVSPWVLGVQGEAVPMANAVVIGLALVAAALGAMLVPRAWEEWTELVLGLWLVVSPWALQFTTLNQARLDAVIAGIVVMLLAVWTLFSDKEYSGWWRNRTAH